MNIIRLSEGDIITVKKNHPCADQACEFTVMRTGSDICLRCNNCRHVITLPRVRLEKSIKLVNGEKPL